MAFRLLRGRIRVQLDEGKTDRGMIVERNLPCNRSLTKPVIAVPWPEIPEAPDDYEHIIFSPDMATEVEIGGETFMIMTTDAVFATLD